MTPAKTTISLQTPQYGGVFKLWIQTDTMGFDEGYAVHTNITTAAYTQDTLIIGDYSNGPASQIVDWVWIYQNLKSTMGC